MQSPLFSKGVVDDVVLQPVLAQPLLQPRILSLQLLEPLGHRHAHPAKFSAPQLVGRLIKPAPSAIVFHRRASLHLIQEANDLFGNSLLHIQSPYSWGLDSKSAYYSKSDDAESPELLQQSFLASTSCSRRRRINVSRRQNPTRKQL